GWAAHQVRVRMLVRCPGPDQRAYARLEPAVDRRSPRRIASLVRGLQHLRALGTPRLAVVRMVCVRQGEQAKCTNGERQPSCLWRLGVTQVHNSPLGLDLPALPRHVPGGGLDMVDRVKALLVLVQPRPQEVHEFHAPSVRCPARERGTLWPSHSAPAPRRMSPPGTSPSPSPAPCRPETRCSSLAGSTTPASATSTGPRLQGGRNSAPPAPAATCSAPCTERSRPRGTSARPSPWSPTRPASPVRCCAPGPAPTP